jgi:hypothetical protein
MSINQNINVKKYFLKIHIKSSISKKIIKKRTMPGLTPDPQRKGSHRPVNPDPSTRAFIFIFLKLTGWMMYRQ